MLTWLCTPVINIIGCSLPAACLCPPDSVVARLQSCTTCALWRRKSSLQVAELLLVCFTGEAGLNREDGFDKEQDAMSEASGRAGSDDLMLDDDAMPSGSPGSSLEVHDACGRNAAVVQAS